MISESPVAYNTSESTKSFKLKHIQFPMKQRRTSQLHSGEATEFADSFQVTIKPCDHLTVILTSLLTLTLGVTTEDLFEAFVHLQRIMHIHMEKNATTVLSVYSSVNTRFIFKMPSYHCHFISCPMIIVGSV